MKKLTTLVIILCIWSTSFAQKQQTLPELFQVNESQTVDVSSFGTVEKMEGVLSNPMYLEVRKVEFTNLPQIAQNELFDNSGYFKFSIPASNLTKATGDVLVSPVNIETLPSGDYTYFADLLIGQDGKGSMVLTHQEGKTFGSIILEDRIFRIEDSDSGEQLLIELNQKLINSAVSCGTADGAKITDALGQSSGASNRVMCSSKIVRVLVLFTARANNISNPTQLSTTLVNELTSSLTNSRIYSSNLRFQLVSTQSLAYTETGNAVTDLSNLVSNTTLNTLRQNAHADLVVVLTDGNYFVTGGQILGIATLDEYSQANDGHVAIVEADAGNLTFAHEVGHLMGCRHDNDSRTNVPNLSNTAKGHNWYYRNWFLGSKHYQKSVVASGTTQGSIVLYFSNPAVQAHSKARDNTGTSTRNNYAQLLNAASVVGCYDSFDDMTVSISGPSSAQMGESVTFSSSVSNCTSRTYNWAVSYDGFYYSSIGTGSSVSHTVFPVSGNNSVYFRLTVTCSDGQVRSAFRSVYVFGDCDDPFIPCLELKSPDTEVIDSGIDESSVRMVMYPNPSADEVIVTFSASADSDVIVEAYSMLSGQKLRLYKGKTQADVNELTLDVSKLNQGLYQLMIMLDDSEFEVEKLMIKR